MLNSVYAKEGGKGVVIPKKDFIKEHRHLVGVLKKGKKSELNAEAEDQSKELKTITGAGPIPPKSVLHQMAKAAYQANPPAQIGEYALVRNTPTLKFYRFQKTIIVAIRGTNPTDATDLKADALIAVGSLEKSDRFKKDIQIINQETAKYPVYTYDWYGVGHSLGGAILDLLLEKRVLKEGISYNPAVQTQHYQNEGNKRIYNANDPLYGIMGHRTKNKEVREAPKRSWWDVALNAVPVAKGLKWLYGKYQSHALDQFEGGRSGPIIQPTMKKTDWERAKKRFGPNDSNRPHLKFATYEDFKADKEKHDAERKADYERQQRGEYTEAEKEGQRKAKELMDKVNAKVRTPTTCPPGEKYSKRRAYDLDDSVCVEKPNAFGVKQATPISYRELVGLDAKVQCKFPGAEDKYTYETADKCQKVQQGIRQKNMDRAEARDNSLSETAARWTQNLAKKGVSKLASTGISMAANAVLPGSGFVASSIANQFIPTALDSVWDTRTIKQKYEEKTAIAPEYQDLNTREIIPAEPWADRQARIEGQMENIPADKLGYDPTEDDWGTHQDDYGKAELENKRQEQMGRRGRGKIPIETRLKLLLKHCAP